MYSGRFRSSKKEQPVLLPFPHGKIKPDLAATLAEMEKEYVRRYNVLLNNRAEFANLIQNVSIALHDKGVDSERVNQLCALLAPEHVCPPSSSSDSQ